MLYETRKFVFTVSLCAMLAVNPVLATAPGEEEAVSTVHDVYTESTNTGTEGAPLNLSSGIAGVTYVNRMVNSAGNAAQRAEDHAAAAGASAIAAQSAADDAQSAADAAKNTLKDKVDISQGTDNKNKVMTTDESGNVVSTMVLSSDNLPTATMETAGIVKTFTSSEDLDNLFDKGVSPEEFDKMVPTLMAVDEMFDNHTIYSDNIYSGAVTTNKIANRAVTAEKIGAVSGYAVHTYSGIKYEYRDVPSDYFLISNGGGGAYWSGIHPRMLPVFGINKIRAANVVGATSSYSGSFDDASSGMALVANGNGSAFWGYVSSTGIADGAVTTEKIADGAVTPAQTAGVVGVVPWGSAASTTYGQFWIE